VDDSSHIADVSRIYYTTRPGVRVKLGKSDVAEYSLRYKSLFAGRKQMDVMHYDQIIGQCVVSELVISKSTSQLYQLPRSFDAMLNCVTAPSYAWLDVCILTRGYCPPQLKFFLGALLIAWSVMQ